MNLFCDFIEPELISIYSHVLLEENIAKVNNMMQYYDQLTFYQ